MIANLLVHQRLGKRRLVAFIVAIAPIAEHVDDNGLVEALTEFDCNLRRKDHRFRIVAVDVEDRRLDHLRHIGWIGRRPRIARIGRKADLIVDDEVDRSTSAMSLQARQTEAFGNNALTGESRIAVDQQRQNLRAFDDVVQLVLLGANLAEHHRIGDFKMRRVGGQ